LSETTINYERKTKASRRLARKILPAVVKVSVAQATETGDF